MKAETVKKAVKNISEASGDSVETIMEALENGDKSMQKMVLFAIKMMEV